MSGGLVKSVLVAAVAILGIIAAAALIPTPTGGLLPHPAPVALYDSAAAQIAARQRDEQSIVAPGGGTVLMTHGVRTPRAVVLLHGFSNSPRQFVELGRTLFEDGDNVYIPRSPGQAEKAADIGASSHVTAEELRDADDQFVDVATGLGDTVIVAGLSLGGTMAAWAAQFRPQVRRVVAIAPALELSHTPEFLAGPLVNFSTRAPNFTRRETYDSAHPDRELGFTTRGLAQALRLGLSVRKFARRLPPAAREIAFLVNAHDGTVKTEPVLELARDWSSNAHVSVYELPDSLGLPHDVIDPTEPGGKVSIVYSVVIALLHGERPRSTVRRLVSPSISCASRPACR